MRLRPLVVLLAAAALIAGCGGDDRRRVPAGGGDEGATATGCRRVAQPPPKRGLDLPAPSRRLDPRRRHVAVVATSCGTFRITLAVRRAPRTTASFAYLARRGFYDRLTFHRVIPGFLIQTGDPRGDGSGDPGYTVVEPPPRGLRYTRAVVAMAKGQFERVGSSGSQFFVVLGDDLQLPPEYALLGRVSSGWNVVERIAAVDADPSTEQPTSPVTIDSVRVTAG